MCFYLRNTNTTGAANKILQLTEPYSTIGDEPLVGDWDGDGYDSIGVHAGAGWYLRNTLDSGRPNGGFLYGYDTDIPLVW